MKIDLQHIRTMAALRESLDDMIGEADAEVVEHEQHVADAKARAEHLRNLRAAMDVPPATEPRR